MANHFILILYEKLDALQGRRGGFADSLQNKDSQM